MAWFAVFLLAFALRLANVFLLADTPLYQVPHGDGRVYLDWADSIRAAGLVGLFERGEVFYQDPLYPYGLAVFRGFFGDSLLALRVGQAALGAGTAVLIGRATERMVGRWAGIAAGGIVAIHSTSIWLDGLVQKSALVAFLFALVLYLSTFEGRRGRLALGIAVGLLMLTRGEARLYALVLAGWIAFQRRPDRLVAYGVGLAVVLVPVLIRNAAIGGEAMLTTSQAGTNFFIGNAKGSNGTYAPLVPGRGDARFEREDAKRIAEEVVGRELSAREVSAYWRDLAFEQMADDPLAAAGRLARKGALALSSTEIADTDDLGHAASTSVVLKLGPGFLMLFALAALGAVLAREGERRALHVPLMLGATQWVALVVFFVFARYRMPLQLALVPLAGLALASLLRVKERRTVSVLAFLGAIAVSLFPRVSFQAADPDRGRAAALVVEGNTLADLGRFTDAEATAVRAIELTPGFFDAHKLHAKTLLRQDRSEAALGPLAIAHGIAPGDWQVRAWLGIALGEVGETRRAYGFLEACARERPEALPIVSNAVALAVAFQDRATAIELLRLRLGVAPIAGARPMRLQLAWLLATSPDNALRDGAEALRTVAELDEDPVVLDVRAAALAELQRFDEAVATIDRAIPSAGQRMAEMQRRRNEYAAGRPWRE